MPAWATTDTSAVQNVMRDQAIDEFRRGLDKLLGFSVQLLQRLGKAVRDLHIASAQFAQQLHLVIAGDTDCAPRLDHPHRYPQHPRNVGTAIHQVAEEHYLAPIRMAPRRRVVPQLLQQLLQLAPTAVNIADDVERTVITFAIAPKRLPFDGQRFDCLGRIQNVDVTEALAVEPSERAAHLLHMLADHVIREITIGPRGIALGADSLRNVEHDRYRYAVILASERDQRLARLGLHIGRVNYRETPCLQPLGGDEVQHLECLDRRRLIVLVVAYKSSTKVRRKDFGREEGPPREGRLARAGRSNQHHQRELRDGNVHRPKTAIWVGAPTAASSFPTGRNRGSYPKRSPISWAHRSNSARVHSKRWSR